MLLNEIDVFLCNLRYIMLKLD